MGVSIFTYGTFYFAYMPTEVHEEEVNFQFSSCPKTQGACSFPNCTLELNPRKHRLMIGQPYRIAVTLDVPESLENQELGMFMSCLTIVGNNGDPIIKICKSSILEFKPIMVDRSSLLRVMETMVFSPLLLTGATSQKQRLDIVYTSEFYNDPGNMAARIEMEIQSQFIQIYSSHLRIHAELSGLRYVMHHHPWLSSLSGILANVAVLTIIILISWTRLFAPDAETLHESQGYQINENIQGEEVQEIGTLSESLNSHVEFTDLVRK